MNVGTETTGQKIIVGIVVGVVVTIVGAGITVLTGRLTGDKPEPAKTASLTAFGAAMDQVRSGPGYAIVRFKVTNDGDAAARNCVAHLDDTHGRTEESAISQPSLPAGATQEFSVGALRGKGAQPLYPFVKVWVSCGKVSSGKDTAVIIPAS